jgi:hypothetical protein
VAHAAGANSPFEVVDLTLYQGIAVRAPTAVHVDVRAGKATVRFGERRTLAYKATVRPAGAVVDPGARVGGAPSALSVEEFYRDITFHGPRFQGIVALDGVAEGFMHGRVRSGVPADFVPDTPRRAWVVDPLAVDSAMQLTAMVAWSRFGRAGTPIGLRRLVQLAPLPAGEVLVEADFGDAEDDRFTATFRLRDPATGALLLVAEDVAAELRKVDEKAPEEPEAFEVKAEWVDPGRWAVVRDLDMRLQLAEASGVRNPYFSVHEGTARNTTVVAGRELVNFSSYNYLGLSGDPRVLDNVKVAIDRYGTSVSASRVASGERPFHQELEAELAECQGAEDSLVFTAGHATNVTAIGHLMGPKDLILHDELIHDSALQGIKLAGSARRSFRHDDPEHLEQQLRALRSSFEKVLIVVEGVYSMDGDICALPTYLELKKKYGALLMVDEAHSFGIIGQRGCGAGEHFGIDGREVDLWMGTPRPALCTRRGSPRRTAWRLSRRCG